MKTFPIHVHQYQSRALEIQVPASEFENFKELVHRATNLWPDAPPSIKAFADLVTNDGKLMQDYSKPTVTIQPRPSHKVCPCDIAGNVSLNYMETECDLSCPKHP